MWLHNAVLPLLTAVFYRSDPPTKKPARMRVLQIAGSGCLRCDFAQAVCRIGFTADGGVFLDHTALGCPVENR